MKLFALLIAAALLIASHATAQTSGQWRFSQRNANGTYTDYGLTAVNGQAIGFTGGVPSMLPLSGGTWGSITGTLSAQTDLQSALDARQPLDSDLTSIAALTTATFGRSLLTQADAATARSTLGLGTLATQSGTLSDYLTSATAATTYAPLTSPAFTGTVSASQFSAALGSLSGQLGFGSLLLRYDSNTGFGYTISATAASASHLLFLPQASGTFVSTGDTGTVTNTMLAGSIALGKLAQGGATSGQAIAWNGTAWAPTTISTGLTIGTTAITSGTSGTVLYNNGGTLGQMTTSGSGTQLALTASPTITTPVIARINDASGNETLMLSSTASAVNEVTIANAATGNPPTIRPTGGDTNIDLSLGGKGTGWTRVVGSTDTTGGLFLTVPGTWNAGDAVTLTFGDTSTNSSIRVYWSQASEWRSFYGTKVIGGSPGGTIGMCVDAASSISFGEPADAFLVRDAAAALQLGRDAASPIAQTLKAHDGTGTNADGASLTISGGTSTGTGDDGDLILRSTMTGTTGSSANSQQTRQQIVARFRNLTEGTATDVVSIALGSGRVTGGTATITVWANDGTDFQALTSEVRFGAVNKAGTVTATCTQTDGTTAASAGTLTVTYDATTSGNNVILRANATSSLTQTILRSRIVITALNGDDTQVVTPQ